MKRDFSLFTGLLKTARIGDDMVLTGIASSTIKDRHGDVMTPKALESMLRTADGMTIYLNHSYNVPEDVAGTVRSAWIDKTSDELHDLHLEIGINSENPRAVQAFNAIDKGTKLGLSIGAMIPEGGAKRQKSGAFVIDEVELLETSIVSIPANPRSWVEYARKSLLTKEDVPEIEDVPEEVPEEPVIEDDPRIEHEPVTVETYAIETTEITEPELCEGCGLVPNDCSCDPDTCKCNNTRRRKDIEPDITDATVSIETPYANINIDTGNRGGKAPAGASSQEATPQAEPETEESDATDGLAAALGEMTRDMDPEVQSLLEPTVMASLQTSRQMMEALVFAVEKAVDRASRAEAERDEVVKAAKVLTETTEAFIARVAATPRGRRAIARELPEATKSLEGIRESGLYSDDFMTILTKGATK